MFFDGSCPFCRADIGHYRPKNQVGALCFIDITEAGAVLRKELPSSEQ
jgi:predicted DCC family thiol-disulfide oxidoreductase YuxK